MSGEKVEQLFSKGSRVETSTDDEGFKGAWYGGTAVEAMANDKVLVEYETLLADNDDDNGEKPLIEYVDASFVRPLPPTTQQDLDYSFELDDLVDAYHRDGWWAGVVTGVLDQGRFLVSFQNPPEEIEFGRSDLRIHRDWVHGKWVRPQKQDTKQQNVDALSNETIKSSRRKKRARKSQQSIGSNDCKSKKRGRPPVKTLIGSVEGVSPSRTPNQCDEASDRQDEIVIPASLAIATAATAESVDKNESLPFVKGSFLWKGIESMEVFQKSPQKPHFSPLGKFQKEFREGFAIGYMVTFAKVVERTLELRFSDSRSIIDSSLETLVDLESHGFDVGAVQIRLNELLTKKKKEEQLQGESEEVEAEMNKCILEKTQVENEIAQIEVKLRELLEKKETKNERIGTLQSRKDVICEDIRNVCLDFDSIAAFHL